MLYTSAIPNMLCSRIRQFAKGSGVEREWNRLYTMIYEKTYWTHLNKCYTVAGDPVYRFEAGRAAQCAQSWLRTELELAVKEGAKFIIVLGRDAQSWVQQHVSEEVRNMVIPLIHPSGQNAAVWAQTQAKDEKIRVRHE